MKNVSLVQKEPWDELNSPGKDSLPVFLWLTTDFLERWTTTGENFLSKMCFSILKFKFI